MGDPRKHKRMPVNLACNLRCTEGHTQVLATVLDVSFGGLGIVAAQEIPPGTLVEITHSDFPCMQPHQATSKCRVISVRPTKGHLSGIRIGLAFEPPDLEFIQNLLEWVQMQTLVQKMFKHHHAHEHAAGTGPSQPNEAIANREKELHTLRSLIPVCCSCKKVRNDKGYWEHLEAYIRDGTSGVEFSHAICPDCRNKLYPELTGQNEPVGTKKRA